jgi:O-succinylbenzoic acid--CoA ligase
LATGDFFELSPGDKALYCLPTKYIAGNDALAVLFWLDIDFVAPSSHPLTKNETKYDFAAIPLQGRKFIGRIERCKKLIVGGAKMSKSLENSLLKEKTGSMKPTV